MSRDEHQSATSARRGAPKGTRPVRRITNAPLWGGLGLAVVLVLAAGLRAAYLYELAAAPDFAAPQLDPQLNDYWARALVSGDWRPPPHAADPQIRSTPYGRPPGYAYVLAGVYWLGGGSYWAPRLAQAMLGLLNVVLMFVLARSLFGRLTALLGAGLMAAYWAFVYFEGELNGPVFTVFLGLVLLHALRAWHARPALWRLLLAGLVLGVFALFRPNVLLVGVGVLAWLVWVGRRRAARSGAPAGRQGDR